MTYQPFEIAGTGRPGRWLVCCDHAANTVPGFVGGGTLGLPDAEMGRHIAYDIGAAEVARALATRLDAPVILSNFSRLVIDPNRGEDDPTLLMKLYDGTIIPGNRHAGAAELDLRLNRCYRPYHLALAGLMAQQRRVLISIHSFTPQLRARPPRPWHVGILHASDERLSGPLIRRLQAEPDLCVGANQPYTGALPGDTLDRHAIRTGRANVLIELRNDLITEAAHQQAWATRLAPFLEAAAATAGI